jgi:Thioredoxin like C-terminal domain
LTCINWLRQEPYVWAWSQAYRDDGLVVIGVHTPEFSFEHDVDLVRQAMTERGIDYPVVVDNEYAIWSAFANHYWPALYLVDADGIIRDHRFGEGRYEESERLIQRLLGVARELVTVEGLGVEAEADWDHLRTPETYLGYGRSANFASPDGAVFAHRHTFEPPHRLPLNHWALGGEWTIARENVVLEQAGRRIAYRFHARDAISSFLPDRERRSPCACSSMASVQAPHTGWTSTRTGTACSETAAYTSSCAQTVGPASGPSKSRSSSLAPRRTPSPSNSRPPVHAARCDVLDLGHARGRVAPALAPRASGDPRPRSRSARQAGARLLPCASRSCRGLTHRGRPAVASELLSEVERRSEVAVDQVSVGLERECGRVVAHPALEAEHAETVFDQQ